MKEGDIVRVDYEIWIKDTGELYDTTMEEVAKEHGIYDPSKKYKSVVVILGESELLEDVENAIKNGNVGDEIEIEIPPERAYGHRDPKLIRVHSYRELARLDIEPEVGKEVYIRGMIGKIISVTPGRVMVDYNHPLAGKMVKYKLYIREVAEEVPAKVKAIIDMHYADADNFEIDAGEDEITVKVEGKAKFDPNWAMAKPKIIRDLRKHIGNITIRFMEEYPKREEEKPEEKSEEEKEEKSESVSENSADSLEGAEK